MFDLFYRSLALALVFLFISFLAFQYEKQTKRGKKDRMKSNNQKNITKANEITNYKLS